MPGKCPVGSWGSVPITRWLIHIYTKTKHIDRPSGWVILIIDTTPHLFLCKKRIASSYINILLIFCLFVFCLVSFIIYSIYRLQVVPGRAGGGSFKRKKNHIAEKEFAYRMCARWPTIAMSKFLFVFERSFCRCMAVMSCALGWCVCDLTCFQVMWLVVRWFVLLLRCYSVLQRTTTYYSSTTLYYKVLRQYYSVLQSTTPVLLCTTTYYSSTTLYYKVLLQYYSCTTKNYSSTTPVLQSTTPVLLCTTPVLR